MTNSVIFRTKPIKFRTNHLILSINSVIMRTSINILKKKRKKSHLKEKSNHVQDKFSNQVILEQIYSTLGRELGGAAGGQREILGVSPNGSDSCLSWPHSTEKGTMYRNRVNSTEQFKMYSVHCRYYTVLCTLTFWLYSVVVTLNTVDSRVGVEQ